MGYIPAIQIQLYQKVRLSIVLQLSNPIVPAEMAGMDQARSVVVEEAKAEAEYQVLGYHVIWPITPPIL